MTVHLVLHNALIKVFKGIDVTAATEFVRNRQTDKCTSEK